MTKTPWEIDDDPSLRPCRPCGRLAELVPGETGHHYFRFHCASCGSTSFYSHLASKEMRYAQLYDRAEDDNQFAGQLARLRLELLGSVPAWMAPPPRLGTGDRTIVRLLEKRLRVGARVVDWGCGSGRLVDILRRRGFDAIGVEVSWELQAAMARSGIPAIHGTELQTLNDREATAAVTLVQVLEHLADPLGALCQLRSVFRGALFVVSVPSPLRLGALEDQREPWDWPPNHLTWFTARGLAALFERAGLDCSILLPRPSGSDMAPQWWSGLTTTGSRHLGTRILPSEALVGPRRSSRARQLSHGSAAALCLLWMHWGHSQISRALGLVPALRAIRQGLSCASMVALGLSQLPAAGPGRDSDSVVPSAHEFR